VSKCRDPQIVDEGLGSEMCICAQGVPCAYDTSPFIKSFLAIAYKNWFLKKLGGADWRSVFKNCKLTFV
jgi:hypothetical protein